ncbi:MAG: hypothetical protein RIC30_16115 [Marinoscillum sp.]|uniref:hypothetical protein n=1 Tax=Marinoscillum sp. TaxID=2024838 RepID=UPI0032F120C1
MKRLCLFVFIGMILFLQVQAQRSFSDDKATFFNQAMTRLRALDTEPARKVAFDFNNAWTGAFTSANQDMIHSIALQMDKKGYGFDPFFWYYFSYLAFADAQAKLPSSDIAQVLKINDQMVKTMNREEYRNFLLGLNMFMARRIIGKSKNVLALTENGTFQFKLLDEYIVPVEQIEEPIEEKEPINPPDNKGSLWSGPQNDDWNSGQNDPWAEDADPWGDQKDDPWADDSDPWADDGKSSYDDNWVDSENVWGYDDSGEVFEEKADRQFVETIAQDYVAGLQAKYRHPVLEGPAIQLENNSMLIVTPYDSVRIKETDGTFLLKNRVYAGENAVINWPADNRNFKGAVVNLGKFYIRADRADFWSPNATLTFPKLFQGTVSGAYEFKSQTRKPNQLSNFPKFTSNESNIDLILPMTNVRYRGGIEISGNRLSGASVSRKPGKLTLLDGKGNQAILRSERFEFREDSVITSANARLTIKHGSDSLIHPSVEVFYNTKTRELAVLRTKEYNVTPFVSSYFQVNVNAQIINWDMKTDSVNFSILNGKDLIPVTIESRDFFNQERFSRLSAGFQFHPVITSVFYANKFNTREFADEEIANHFNVPIKQVKGAMKVLKQYGFAKYNPETGLVQLNDKAFHYHDASGQKVDYDNLLIPSLSPNQANATWRLDSGDMKVTGVGRFYYTSDFKVYAEPKDQVMTLLRGRNIEMDGMVNAGDFQYKGKNYLFDYDQFLINLQEVDSIRIQVELPDSLKQAGQEKVSLQNHLNETSGTLYLDDPRNKSGLKSSPAFPDFVSESDAIVYFDGPEVLNGAYDRSVKFIIPPFDSDSLSSQEAIKFDGTFNSGGIFPNFEETLKLQPDQSLGFIHQIPPEGYTLYGTAARTYENIRLSNQGMRGQGKIDFITSTIYSKDFVYYPDSVAAYGTGGVIRPGEANGSSYPEAVLGPYRMHWEPRIDSMFLRNIRKPFKFYNATAELDGAVNITSRGVFGVGTMLTRGSRAVSQELTFKEFSYSARHAKFAVLTNNPDKPAMAGDDIRLNFDLKNRTALIQPEKAGVAALSFPYAQMRTSITNAIWNLDDSTVTMTKPKNVPIASSYFYTTRKELDSLAFNAEQATYDFNSRELNVKGIPYIIVADAKIIPENNETTILENFELQSFNNAELIIDTLNEYHYLYSGEIKILSRNEFVGTAMYRLVSGSDTFAIKFDRFVLEEVFVDGKPKLMTTSGGEVLAKENLIIAPGFYYKGAAKMYANKKALELNGAVKLILSDPGYDYWILYERKDNNPEVAVDIETALYDNEDPVVAGLQYDLRGSLYSTFLADKRNDSDEDFFKAKGVLTYDTASLSYRIEKPSKTFGESYDGHTLIYNDQTKNIIFEGPVSFFSPFGRKVTIDASVLGNGNSETNEYNIDAFLAISLENSQTFMDLMSEDLLDIIERLGPPLANDISLELLYKLANFTSDKVAKAYEKASLKDYKPLYTSADNLQKSLVISGVKMKWSQAHKSFYNTTKLAISNIYDNDVNAKLDGFIEIKKDDSNNDAMNIFIQAAPGTWYFISYASNNLLMYSSNSKFNDEVTAKSNFGKSKPGELVLVLGDENETLSFINDFREKYFGITDPYDLVSPDEVNLDDETFDTIEESDDDGFGF